jgi:hypothetical protein
MAATSCVKDSDDDSRAGDGRQPVVLSVSNISAEPAGTRATSGGTWTKNDEVRVRLESGDDFDEVYTYTATTSSNTSSLTPSSALYWQDLNEAGNSTISATAWFPGGYVFEPYQNSGIQAADFIFAPKVTGITMSNTQEKALVFKHMTAKVVVTLQKGVDMIDWPESYQAVSVDVFGYKYVSSVDTISTNATGAITGKGDAWLKTLQEGEEVQSCTYTVLALPREYAAGTSFLHIRFGTSEYDYIVPEGKSIKLEAGYQYNFTITLKRDAVDASSTSITSWTADESPTIINDASVKYTHKYEVGDVYPYNGTAAGIVFAVSDNGRKGKIISLTGFDGKWCSAEDAEDEFYSLASGNSATSGRAFTTELIRRHLKKGDLSDFPALEWVSTLSAGEQIEWYIPSPQEMLAFSDAELEVTVKTAMGEIEDAEEISKSTHWTVGYTGASSTYTIGYGEDGFASSASETVLNAENISARAVAEF